MQATLIELTSDNFTDLEKADTALSFRCFIDYLRKKVETEKEVRNTFLTQALAKLEANPLLAEPVSLSDIPKIQEELELIVTLLLPALSEENEHLALATPLRPQIFFGTDTFYSLVRSSFTGKPRNEVIETITTKETEKIRMKMVYSLILEKVYGIPSLFKAEIVFGVPDEETSLISYFRINIDTRFLEVKSKSPVSQQDIMALLNETDGKDFDKQKLKNFLPLSEFFFSGFSVLTLTDITGQQSIENIKNAIIHMHPGDSNEYYRKEVVSALKVLIRNNTVEFGILPFFRINNKLVLTEENIQYNVMVKAFARKGEIELLPGMLEEYVKKPKIVFYTRMMEENPDNVYMKHLLENNIESYALLPVYNGQDMVGILELYSKQKDSITISALARLDAAMPILAQFLQHTIDGFNRKIEEIIKNRFTSLQSAVEWRFKEEAWRYFMYSQEHSLKEYTDKIIFKEVYPLYGGIDIRNSTIERNEAMVADLIVQCQLVIEILKEIKKQVSIPIVDSLTFKCSTWIQAIETKTVREDNIRISEFLEEEIVPFLTYFHENNPTLRPVIDSYWKATDEETGIAYKNRRMLETSMQTINAAISQQLDQFQAELQGAYPCYFEKFRTDGIEYDIYIGQAITPDKPFNTLYLKNIRLGQLNAMVSIARMTHRLLPKLEKPLRTTQLIFIRSAAIDISFRNDERKFDVEGAYNIRYQIIKKRIDKVHIKNTSERLTQPDTIALVYLTKKEETEYLEYITYLQNLGLLENKVEFLELEELQGVSGLKALRVTVVLEEASINMIGQVISSETYPIG
ncbi:GAF domain-containing protein [Cytophagaceae bacterium YF14B1]|uniref:GAF domain-containing protein n=1 Tax=Xanthocytophaga flava TaxID=3048013 RepID=A0AAE3U9X6_9BACT|nr:GAF domain-containing protein [Xanthocytophaga flavus]MDJ1484921.1 GAF domain-containing protein [Xanthocytophaga flavus]